MSWTLIPAMRKELDGRFLEIDVRVLFVAAIKGLADRIQTQRAHAAAVVSL